MVNHEVEESYVLAKGLFEQLAMAASSDGITEGMSAAFHTYANTANTIAEKLKEAMDSE